MLDCRSLVAPLAVALLSARALAVPISAPGAPQGATPAPGEIALSEVMFDPASPVDDNDGEWFEVTNLSSHALDLSGLFVQDLATLGSAAAPYFQIPAGALPPLYPGESLVFARSADAVLNGGIPKVDYAYAVPVGASVPGDKSKVSHTGMALSNSSVDAIAITIAAPYALGGFVVEMITYDPTKAPFTNHAGIGFERANLLGPWAAENVAPSTASFGPLPQKGTPGAPNANDTTLYPSWYYSPAPQPGPADSGVLLAKGPASVHSASATLALAGGFPGALYAVAVSKSPALVPLLGGTILVDFAQADFWSTPALAFDGQGAATMSVALAPALLGQQFWLQWYSWDSTSGAFRFSNGLGVDVVI